MPDRDQGHSSFKNSDTRYFPRWEVTDRVVYNIDGDGEAREGRTKDISCAGACIIGDRYLSPHQKIQMTVHLSEAISIKLNGHVQWVRHNDGASHMGVTFYETPDHIQELILQHAFEIDREKVVKQWFKGWEDS